MPSVSSDSDVRGVAVVVLNWHGANDTLECLRSLRGATPPVHSIVVDNGSTDDSLLEITASGLADTVLETGVNLGYAEGNNVGLRIAIARGFPIIAVLNNDTVVRAESFSALVDDLPKAEHRALSPDIRYYDDPSRSWFAGGLLDRGWPRHLQPSELTAETKDLRESDVLTGCCIVARRETWQRVGLFDPGYFLIFEDSDWSLRARGRGVKLYVTSRSTIEHKVSRSFASGPSSLLGEFYYLRNGLTFELAYARRHIPAFLLRWLIRPTLSSVARRRRGRGTLFRWLGVAAFVARQRGRAPAMVERLALYLTRTSD